MQKNMRIRMAMTKAGLSQRDLAKILGISEQEASVMLKYDLSKAESDGIIAKIRKANTA